MMGNGRLETGPAPARDGRGRWSVGLRWTARALFAAAVAALGHALWRRAPQQGAVPLEALRKEPVAVDWRRERFQEWTSVEDGISLAYPARFEPVRAFGRFTSRELAGGMMETDVVVFRSAEPRAVIAVAEYRAPRPLAWEEWTDLAKVPVPTPPDAGSKAPAPFSAAFGGPDRSCRSVEQGGRMALAVSASGAVRYPLRGSNQVELWRFESRLVAEGERAVRVTAGVHADQAEAAMPGLARTLESFRWTPR